MAFTISPKKHKRALDEQPIQAQKLYAAVPISEVWSIGRITATLTRLGTPVEYANAERLLSRLVSAGLLYRNRRNEFTRIAVREPAITKIIEDMPMAHPAPNFTAAEKTAIVAPTAIQKLKTVSSRLIDLAEDMEEAVRALEIEQQTNAEQMEKFKKLGALLKELA